MAMALRFVAIVLWKASILSICYAKNSGFGAHDSWHAGSRCWEADSRRPRGLLPSIPTNASFQPVRKRYEFAGTALR